MQQVVQWKEHYKDKEGVEHIRNRKYDWDAESREFIDYENHKPTVRLPIRLLADKDILETMAYESKKIIAFAKKEVIDVDTDTEFKPY